MNSTSTFMQQIAAFDQTGFTPRDFRIMELLTRHPNLCGNDMVSMLKLPSRSSVQANIPKLIRRGMIEDRREREGQAIPSRLFITEKGLEFVRSILS